MLLSPFSLSLSLSLRCFISWFPSPANYLSLSSNYGRIPATAAAAADTAHPRPLPLHFRLHPLHTSSALLPLHYCGSCSHDQHVRTADSATIHGGLHVHNVRSESKVIHGVERVQRFCVNPLCMCHRVTVLSLCVYLSVCLSVCYHTSCYVIHFQAENKVS